MCILLMRGQKTSFLGIDRAPKHVMLCICVVVFHYDPFSCRLCQRRGFFGWDGVSKLVGTRVYTLIAIHTLRASFITCKRRLHGEGHILLLKLASVPSCRHINAFPGRLLPPVFQRNCVKSLVAVFIT